jgi:O-acetyl-ADP-ribose deacetylase (regulator of RNase III)
MSVKVIKGDLIKLAKEGKFEVVCQGNNCFHVQGGGISGQFIREWPGCYAVDKKTVKGDVGKLGTISSCLAVTDNKDPLVVVNCYTQFNPGPDFKIGAFDKCMKQLKESFGNKKIGMPKIGCGIAGGKWEDVLPIIQKHLGNCDVTVVEWEKS